MSSIEEPLEKKLRILEERLSRVRDAEELREISKTYSRFKRIHDICHEAEELLKERSEWLELGSDEEISGEIERIDKRLEVLTRNLLTALLESDLSRKNVVVEIRPGTGGEEAALFAADLFRMYSRYADLKGWSTEVVNVNRTDLGGFKEIVFFVRGKWAYEFLKYEAGVHRVQRVPVTESGGRIHTSTATVAVLPEIEAVEMEIDPKDLKIETFRASGHGGQYVNKTESAVRITHIPTGIVVSIQTERSQHRNKEIALSILRSRLYQLRMSEVESERSQIRRDQIGTGERSEKIRTYNFPQNRVTDHRIGYTTYRLREILDGDLDELITRLMVSEVKKKLAGGGIFEHSEEGYKGALRP